MSYLASRVKSAVCRFCSEVSFSQSVKKPGRSEAAMRALCRGWLTTILSSQNKFTSKTWVVIFILFTPCWATLMLFPTSPMSTAPTTRQLSPSRTICKSSNAVKSDSLTFPYQFDDSKLTKPFNNNENN